MKEHRNEYIYAAPNLLSSNRARRIALTAAVVVIVLLAPLLVIFGGRNAAAERFVSTLLTADAAAIADPQAKLDELNALADEQLVQRLASDGDIPALAIAQAGKNWTTTWQRGMQGGSKYGADTAYADWPVKMQADVKVTDAEDHQMRTSYSDLLALKMELRGIKWVVTDVSDFDWDAEYPLT